MAKAPLWDYAKGAQWVVSRCTSGVTADEVVAALRALTHAALRADADCLVEGLFPGSTLEVLLSHVPRDHTTNLHPPPLPAEVSPSAMHAIGEAIMRAMEMADRQLLTLTAAGFPEVVVLTPQTRQTLLLGTKTTLLDDRH
jgi:hypothetical protein